MRTYTSLVIILGTFLISTIAPVSAKAQGIAFSHLYTSGPLLARHAPDGLRFDYRYRGQEGRIYSELVPYPPRKPQRAAAVPPTGSPDITVLGVEPAFIGGASLSGATIAAAAPARHRMIHTDRDHRSTPRSAMTHRASRAVAGKIAKRLLFGAVPVLGMAILLHDISKMTR